ncbi:glycosyl transferase group 2 family protein [Candidatus Thiomargarita nelsonii]|uniref:Glycosyl transferase group 2 family protein n=1 Tax=Candidatus Thiomargarita nelsonii TaxID=1003181 RepID=A0A176RU64_9GAMM|nr:glycosyl transferase group 2 family protein [Candidatus Thiomargarita nelsonii]
MGLGGTLALASQADISIGIVFVGSCHCEPAARLAADKLGVEKGWFWCLTDSAIQPEQALYDRVVTVIQSWQPATIFAPFPEKTQPAAHSITTALVIAAVEPLNYQGTVWFYELQQQTETNYLVDISSTIDAKKTAAACYEEAQSLIPDSLGSCLELNKLHSQSLSSEISYAEAFRALPAKALILQTQGNHLFAQTKAYSDALQTLVRLHSPLISVIVRTQNRPHLLAKALQSIAAQTYAAVEAVVVNDGGDDVAAVVARFKPLISGGVQLIQHTEVRGRSAAANSGLQAAQGVWIAFLDDDDTLVPEGLARLARFIAWDKDIIYGQVQVLHMEAEPEKIRKAGVFGEPFEPDSLLLNNRIPICAYICKRELAISVGGFDEYFDFLEDWDFFYRLSRQAEVHYVQERVANYCVWGESYVTGKNSVQETTYRRRFFEKRLASFSPATAAEALQRASLNLVKTRDSKTDGLHTHYQTLMDRAEAEHASKLAHVQTAFERKAQDLEAAMAHNKSLVEANQQQHDRVLQLDADLRHVQAAYEHKIQEVEAVSKHNQSLAEVNQQLHDKMQKLEVELNTTKTQLTEKLNTTQAQLAETQAQLNATQQAIYRLHI